jgi:hypothetical protein
MSFELRRGKMSKIIHLQTQVQATFGELDDDGNVVNTFPCNLSIAKLEKEAFALAHEHVVKVREELKQKLANQDSSVELEVEV